MISKDILQALFGGWLAGLNPNKAFLIMSSRMPYSRVIYTCVICGEINYERFFYNRPTKCIGCLATEEELRDVARKKGEALKRKKNIIHVRVEGARSRARVKGLDFAICIKDINKLLRQQKNRCYYTGIRFNENSRLYAMSIDRTDSSKGYTMDNIRLVCASVNLMKLDFPLPVFFDPIEAIYNKRVKESKYLF